MEPSPRSLILDLLTTVGHSAAPVRALVVAGELFDISENTLRVALTRLLADQLVERDRRGRYRLGAAARAVTRQSQSWREGEKRLTEWSGAWIGVQTSAVTGGRAADRRRRARALRLLGFRPLARGLEVRPDNLSGGVDAVRERLMELGLDAGALVFRIDALDAEHDALARTLWNVDELVASYRKTCARLEQSASHLETLPHPLAMAESFLVGGAAIRQLADDPVLPEPIVPGAERRAVIEAMQRYDRLGRKIWSGWLGSQEPEPEHWPANGRGRESAIAPAAPETRGLPQ